MTEYDVAIIGAGPAGLAAAHRCKASDKRTILIDRGRSIFERNKDVEAELTQGHGGAGLFSDGKFSFFPSASALWNLPCHDALQSAYKWTCDLLQSYGLDTPPLPSGAEAHIDGSGEWVLKKYPSSYLALSARLELIAQLVGTVTADIVTEAQVSLYHYVPKQDAFLCLLQKAGSARYFTARRVIVTTGRFGPLGMPHMAAPRFRRLEVGFRIAQPRDLAFFKDMPQLDPKLKFQSDTGDVEWRTFCACRCGQTVLTQTQGLWTVSGHSDGPPSERSNVGFNTRILDEEQANLGLQAVLSAAVKKDSYFSVKLTDVLANVSDAVCTFNKVYGDPLRKMMWRGMHLLIEKFPSVNHPDTILIGPTIEGVGWYPDVDGSLRAPDEPVWIAGDACGLFRGIVAALISGHYAASCVLEDLLRSRT